MTKHQRILKKLAPLYDGETIFYIEELYADSPEIESFMQVQFRTGYRVAATHDAASVIAKNVITRISNSEKEAFNVPDEVTKIRTALERKIPKTQQVYKVKIIRLDGKVELAQINEIIKRFPGCYERIQMIREHRIELLRFIATTTSKDLKSFETKFKIRMSAREVWSLVSYMIINDIVRFDKQGQQAKISEVATWLLDHVQVLQPRGGNGIKKDVVNRNVGWNEVKRPGKNAYSECYEMNSYDERFNTLRDYNVEDIISTDTLKKLCEQLDTFKP